MPRSRYHILNGQSPHFMTATINHWLPLFTRPATVDIVLDSWRYLQREVGFTLYGYVILENHLHLDSRLGGFEPRHAAIQVLHGQGNHRLSGATRIT